MHLYGLMHTRGSMYADEKIMKAGLPVVLKFLIFLKFYRCPEIVLKIEIFLKFYSFGQNVLKLTFDAVYSIFIHFFYKS